MKGIQAIAFLLILGALSQVGSSAQHASAAGKAHNEAACEWLEAVDVAAEEAVLVRLAAHNYCKQGTAIAKPDHDYTQGIVLSIAKPPPKRL